MGQALYRTYRSKKLTEVVGQEHITRTLNTALEKGLISHAYLFTGPRGTGKTSIARILAHEINSLPYNDESIHLDIIEIDAASNRRIDEIRDLRDKVHIAPTSAKYKVYIIDEVHMLTREAFNALLKTLEEPPAHVVFILATTEVHKLPETIISRTQRFTFRPISSDNVAAHLRTIAAQEKIEIDDSALQLIAEHGGGSMRDSISIFDQIRSLNRAITAADVISQLGVAPAELILALVENIERHDASEVMSILKQLYEQGAEATQIAKQLGQLLRERFIANEQALTHEQTISLLTKLLDVPSTSDPATFLEIALLDIALAGRPSGVMAAPHAPAEATKPPKIEKSKTASNSETTTVSHAIVAKPAHVKIAQPKATPTPTAKTSTDVPAPAHLAGDEGSETHMVKNTGLEPPTLESPAQVSTTSHDGVLTMENWADVVAVIKKKYNTLYSILRTARPSFEPGVVKLEVGFAFHQKRLSEPRNKENIATIIEQVTGQSVQLICVLGEQLPSDTAAILPSAHDGEVSHNVGAANAAVTAITDKPAQDEPVDYYVQEANKASERPLDTVSNIFGGGELLES